MSFPLYDFGGSGPLLHVSIANGFPPETYRPLLDPLTGRYHVVCLLPRPLWPDPPDPQTLTTWRVLASDLLDGLRAHGMDDVILLGHSMGGLLG